MGCDYCGTIKGVGPKKAFELISEHGSIEKALLKIDRDKFTVPENFEQDIVPVHEFFVHPEVRDVESIELKWNDPDEEGLLKFLCDEKQFNRERITKSLEKIKKSRGTATQVLPFTALARAICRFSLSTNFRVAWSRFLELACLLNAKRR
jgi:flap endonuclease-1